MQFLAEVWPDDDDAIATLQEIFGLCLTDETRFQKAFMLIGPKRSGKGTIGRVLRGLVGANNFVGPTLNGLTTQFGLQSFIGKKVAVFSDARLDARANASVIAERLLSITGEDAQDIDRKYLRAWSGILGTRIVVLSNELPAFKDESGALASRFVLLRIERSFYGNEDTRLTDRLLAERPGILNWALEGWDRLRDRGYFVQPESARQIVEDLATMSSNIQAFVEERCEVGAEFSVECGKLYFAWCAWNERNGVRQDLPINLFSGRLTTAVTTVRTFRPRDSGDPKRPRWFSGIKLRRK
jgi:putative DNA primase/helicase